MSLGEPLAHALRTGVEVFLALVLTAVIDAALDLSNAESVVVFLVAVIVVAWALALFAQRMT